MAKNRKMDRNRIALGQKHELEYLRRSARGILGTENYNSLIQARIERIIKAFLLLSSKKKIAKIIETNEDQENLIDILNSTIISLKRRIIYWTIGGIIVGLIIGILVV